MLLQYSPEPHITSLGKFPGKVGQRWDRVSVPAHMQLGMQLKCPEIVSGVYHFPL